MADHSTISSAPRITPHRTLLYQSPPAIASSGSSTNSASGFSSKVSVKYDPAVEGGGCGVDDLAAGGGGAPWVTVGEMLRKDLKPT